MNVEEILISLGYVLSIDSKGWRSPAIFRDGDNPSSLLIYKNGNWIDFVESKRGTLKDLVHLTLKTKTVKDAEDWLKNKNFILEAIQPELTLKVSKIFPLEILQNLKPDHSYWINRGIKKEVLEEFGGGIATDKIPKLNGRYIFPIWNSKKQLVGLQGRSLNGKNPRYKILGEKSSFCFPLHLNAKEIKRKSEIILVEGVGCVLSCFEAGITNTFCLFGVGLSNYQLSVIIGINPKKIILALNNDGKAGNEGAIKMQKRLCKFFDKNQVEIRLPKEKDLNELLTKGGVEAINEWYKL